MGKDAIIPGKKMILLSQEHYDRLRTSTAQQNEESKAPIVKSNIIGAVKRPREQELVKVYNRMENALQDVTKSPSERVNDHAKASNEFSIIRDKVTDATFKRSKVDTNDTDNNETDKMVDDTAEMMPKTLQHHARKLMKRMKEYKDVIRWSSNGDVFIDGNKMVGSNISDLIGDVLRSKKTEIPGRETFLRALAKINTPEELVRNIGALAKYRAIKSQSFSHPPGIPDTQELSGNNPEVESRIRNIERAKRIKKLASAQKHGGNSRIKWKNF